jgi:hypothetical protein
VGEIVVEKGGFDMANVYIPPVPISQLQ